MQSDLGVLPNIILTLQQNQKVFQSIMDIVIACLETESRSILLI